jgi:hypothetical protein
VLGFVTCLLSRSLRPVLPCWLFAT